MLDTFTGTTSCGLATLGQSGNSGFVERGGHRWTNSRRIDTPSFTASVLDGDIYGSGDWYSDEVHCFDLSLSGRPADAHGCFPDAFSDDQRVGDIFFVPAGYRYRGSLGTGRQQRVSLFLRARAPLDNKQLLDADLTPVLPYCMRLQSNVLRKHLSRIAHEICEPSFASELLIEGLSITLLAETARLLHTILAGNARKGGLPAWRMKIIKDRVLSDQPQPMLNELAELCGLSRRHLIRAFREETGQTIGAFVQHVKIERAKTLLSETEQPINAVAAALGFTNPAAFATAFRRVTGQSPRNFRATCRVGTLLN